MADHEDAETKARLFANRAAALMNIGRSAYAISDCEKVRFSSWRVKARRIQCGWCINVLGANDFSASRGYHKTSGKCRLLFALLGLALGGDT